MAMKYTDEHEWVRAEGDLVVVGITDYAQEQLGEVVFVELPEIDRAVTAGEETVVIESVKAASEIKSPVAGTVTAINDALDDAPETINADATGAGWIYKLKPDNMSELDALMDADAYQSFVESLA